MRLRLDYRLKKERKEKKMEKLIDGTIMLLALIGIFALIGSWEKHERKNYEEKNYEDYEGEKDENGKDLYEDS